MIDTEHAGAFGYSFDGYDALALGGARVDPILSRYDAFDGKDHTEDPVMKGFIRDDGEHPTELASQFTAELLSKMGYNPVEIP